MTNVSDAEKLPSNEDYHDYPYMNMDLSLEERVEDLFSRLTFDGIVTLCGRKR